SEMEHYCTNLTLLELEKLPEHTDVFQLENGTFFYYKYSAPQRLYLKWEGIKLNATLPEEWLGGAGAIGNGLYFLTEGRIYKASFEPARGITVEFVRIIEKDEMAYSGALVSVKRNGPKRFYRMSETADNDFITLDDDKFERTRPKGVHRRKIIFAAANENISEPVVHQHSSNVLSIEFPIAESQSVWPDESSPFIYVSNQNSLFALNTDTMHFLPTLRFMNVLVDSIVGVDNGVLTVSGKNEKGQLRLFTVELPQGFKVAEDSTIAAFHCDCF
ncbi:hypothetical protein PRIPAC_90908, partial [Pristionchus pacificus]